MNFFQNKWVLFVIGILIGAGLFYWFVCSEHAKAQEAMRKFLDNHQNASGKEIYDIYTSTMDA